MNDQAAVALRHHCRLALETLHPRFSRIDLAGFSVILTVNTGYE
jgi:hypothetical protein